MRVWLLKVGEPLPIDGSTTRLLRAGTVAEALIARGAEVVWWTSNFDHVRKTKRFDATTSVKAKPGLKIWCLDSRPYLKNVSLDRIGAHRDMAREFVRLSVVEPTPDVVVASYPTPELASAAGRYAKERGIRSYVDVRDLWPDIWAEVLPKPLRPLAPIALAPFHIQARETLRQFDNVLSITDEMLEWAVRKHGGKPDTAVYPLAQSVVEHPGMEQARLYWRKRLKDVDLRLCYFGGLPRRTNPAWMINAIKSLPCSIRCRVQLVVCGTGGEEDNLRRLHGSSGSDSSVYFAGWVDAPKLRALAEISHAGVLAYPNSMDFQRSIPNKVGEYLSGGLPVITGLRGPLRRLIENEGCGRVYDDGEGYKSLSRVIADLFQRPEQITPMAAAARRVFAERFDATKIYGAYADAVLQGAGHR